MVEWVAATILARFVCGVLVVGLRRVLAGVARRLDGLFAGHPTAELFSVMLACPLAMNLIQVQRIGGYPFPLQPLRHPILGAITVCLQSNSVYIVY